jgi:hypothetical protein
MQTGASLGFFLGLLAATKKKRAMFRYIGLGMGVGAGYALQEANERFKDIKL